MDTLQMLGKRYVPRLIDEQVTSALRVSGAILLEGPRGCGKTMTAVHHAASAVFLDDPAVQDLMTVDPWAPLDGDSPRLIDEWQLEPQVWNRVRRRVDALEGFGHFILTGSSVPDDDATRHSGAGRFLRIQQRTMTWVEKGKSIPTVSLRALFGGEKVSSSLEAYSLDDNVAALLTSGFPAQVSLTATDASHVLNAYLAEIARTDIAVLGTIRHEPEVIDQLLRSLARNTASEVTLATVRKDLLRIVPEIKERTIASYLRLLMRLFVIESVPAWTPKLRSRARLRTARKYHLADASLAAAALGAGRDVLMSDVKTLGFLFESAVVHDLAVMTEAMGGRISHYRDSNGYEIDAILQLPDGRWGAVEVKLGIGAVTGGIERLNAAIAQIDADRPPSFAAVISGTGMTYTANGGAVTFPFLSLGM